MLREPAQPALEVIAALRGAHRAAFRSWRWATLACRPQARAAGAVDFLRTPTYIRDVVNVAKLVALAVEAEARRPTTPRRAVGVPRPLLSAARDVGDVALVRAPAGARAAARGDPLQGRQGRVGQRARAAAPAGAPPRAALGGGRRCRSSAARSRSPASSRCPRRRSWTSASASCATSRTRRAISARRTPSTSRPPSRAAGRRHAAEPDGAAAAAVRRQPRTGRRRRGEPVPDLRHHPDDQAPARRRALLERARQRRATGGTSAPGTRAAPRGTATGPQSMLGQWAMVPDQRGVVGDRRSPSRPLMPFGPGVLDQPGGGGDRRSRPSRPVAPLAGARACGRAGGWAASHRADARRWNRRSRRDPSSRRGQPRSRRRTAPIPLIHKKGMGPRPPRARSRRSGRADPEQHGRAGAGADRPGEAEQRRDADIVADRARRGRDAAARARRATRRPRRRSRRRPSWTNRRPCASTTTCRPRWRCSSRAPPVAALDGAPSVIVLDTPPPPRAVDGADPAGARARSHAGDLRRAAARATAGRRRAAAGAPAQRQRTACEPQLAQDAGAALDAKRRVRRRRSGLLRPRGRSLQARGGRNVRRSGQGRR